MKLYSYGNVAGQLKSTDGWGIGCEGTNELSTNFKGSGGYTWANDFQGVVNENSGLIYNGWKHPKDYFLYWAMENDKLGVFFIDECNSEQPQFISDPSEFSLFSLRLVKI